MDLDQALQRFRSYRTIFNTGRELQEKEINQKKVFSKKRNQEIQFRSLLFSRTRFQMNAFFSKLRLMKLINRISAFRRRKNRSRMIQQLHEINEAMAHLEEHRKKQAEEQASSLTIKFSKPLTFSKDLITRDRVFFPEKNDFNHIQSDARKSTR